MNTTTDDPRWQLAGGYRIAVFAGQNQVGAADVIALWTREAGLSPTEAGRRADEVLLVATDAAGSLAGVCTAYLARNGQLRAELWHFRAFVARAHRQSNIAVALAVSARDLLVERFVSGEDRRGIGILFEVENEGLKRHFPQARWLPTDFLFIGENARGAHVRVHYFPGAAAPEPPQ
jgi:hypothetical protein